MGSKRVSTWVQWVIFFTITLHQSPARGRQTFPHFRQHPLAGEHITKLCLLTMLLFLRPLICLWALFCTCVLLSACCCPVPKSQALSSCHALPLPVALSSLTLLTMWARSLIVGRGNALLTRVNANSSSDNPASVSRWSIRLLRVALAMCSLQMPKFQYFGNFLILFYYQFIANVFKIYKHTIICTIYFRKQFTVTTRAISCKF